MPQELAFQILDLSGGVDAKTNPMLLRDDQVARAINADLGRIDGAIARRLGYSVEGSAAAPASDILGLGNLAKPDGTHKVVAVCGSDAYVYDPVDQEWDAQNQSLSSAMKAEFRTFLNQLFMANYANDTRVYSGSTWSTTTNLGAASGSPSGAPRAKFIEVYENRLYLGNCVIQPTAYPSRVYFSSLPDSNNNVNWNTTEVTGDYIEVETDDNDMVRGLAVNSNRLFIFKEYSLHLWDGTSRVKVQGAPGTTSQRSIVNIDEWTYYFNRDGVFRFNGGIAEYISEPVKPYIDGLSAASTYQVRAGEKDKHYLVYIGDTNNTTEELVERKTLLDFDTKRNRWAVQVLNTRATAFLSCPTGAF